MAVRLLYVTCSKSINGSGADGWYGSASYHDDWHRDIFIRNIEAGDYQIAQVFRSTHDGASD